MTTKIICTTCNQPIAQTEGYGVDNEGNKHCYACCAKRDMAEMDATGKQILYLDTTGKTVTNWPGSLVYKVNYLKEGRHNIARVRHDVWFNDHNGDEWHGTQYGDFTQLCHCKRLKKKTTKDRTMLHFRSVTEVIGYTADADTWCPQCAQEIYGDPDNPNTEDNEGNPIHPIFLGDEWDYTPTCGACHERLE